MFLANCNIKELVTKHMNSFIAQSDWSFLELKSALINKLPLEGVQTQITNLLITEKKSDLALAKEKLHKHMLKKQITEDKQQSENEAADALQDASQKEKLLQDMALFPDELIKYENEYSLLRLKLTQALASSRLSLTEIAKQSNRGQKKLTDNESNRAVIYQLQNDMHAVQLQMKALNSRKRKTQKQLNDLEKKANTRNEHQNKRNLRSQAVEAYNSTGEGIYDTLTNANRSQLTNSLQKQFEALEQKCLSLLEEAAAINYSIFLEELPQNFAHFKLTNQELEALQSIIKLMKKHLNYSQQTANIQNSLDLKKQAVISQQKKLLDLHTKVQQLSSLDPGIVAKNKALTDENTQLKEILDYNNELQQRLSKPFLLLSGLSFFSLIPLILAFKEVIMVSTLMFSILSASLVCAAVACGITSMVCAYRAKINDQTIKSNLQTIAHNNSSKKQNSQEIKTLENVTIPNLKELIKKDEQSILSLEISLAESTRQVTQTLEKANSITPSSFAKSSILSSQTSTQSQNSNWTPVP